MKDLKAIKTIGKENKQLKDDLYKLHQMYIELEKKYNELKKLSDDAVREHFNKSGGAVIFDDVLSKVDTKLSEEF